MQPQLHADGLFPVQPFQQRHHLRPKAVRPGADGQPHDVLRGHGLPIEGFQSGNRGVGVGKGLKIGDVFAALILGGHPGPGLFQLGGDAAAVRAEVAAAPAGAENTAPGIQCAVPVGAGEACVDGKPVDLAAEAGAVGFIGSYHKNHRCYHTSFPGEKQERAFVNER